MPDLPNLLAFLTVAAVLTITPGADMALVTRQTLALGRRAAFYTTLGICMACLAHATLSALGVAFILARSGRLFQVMKLMGGAYLVYVGARTLWEAGRSTLFAAPLKRASNGSIHGRCFIQGCLTNLLNPKVALFYLTFLPQFVSPRASALGQSLALGVTHVVMGFAWLSAYAAGIDRFAAAFGSHLRRRLEQITGGILVVLGIRLALSQR